ncbi:MAG TPA: dodecin [Nitriliruptoraceae bacterium]|nr:dodecin [Nitriliruptoraceae bacterium]
MSNVYKKVELVGSSSDSIEDAIQIAISKAGASTRNLDWFEVDEIRGWIDDNVVQHYQVTLKVGFRVDDQDGVQD